jgi:hypothetical protein
LDKCIERGGAEFRAEHGRTVLHYPIPILNNYLARHVVKGVGILANNPRTIDLDQDMNGEK